MLNYRKIAKVLLVAAFFCTFIGAMSNNSAWAIDDAAWVKENKTKATAQKTAPVAPKVSFVTWNGNKYYKSAAGKWVRKGVKGQGDAEIKNASVINILNTQKASDEFSPIKPAAKQVDANTASKTNLYRQTYGEQVVNNVSKGKAACETGGGVWKTNVTTDKEYCHYEMNVALCTSDKRGGNGALWKDTDACKKLMAGNVAAGSNKPQTDSGITGCKQNRGLFSGLITTGEKIFSGLRDLIYVVAGFGIIGVAVGGFFGNLNWKWLGAIIIGLVVIATTGELINAITGCPDYTSSMIADTLK